MYTSIDQMMVRVQALSEAIAILKPRPVIAEVRCESVETFLNWLATACAGARCVYHRDVIARGNVCAEAREAFARGEVTLVQDRRREAGINLYIAERLRRPFHGSAA